MESRRPGPPGPFERSSVARNVLVLLLGTNDGRAADLYQDLQGKAALVRGAALGVHVEVVFCSGFGQYRVIRKRLGETDPPLDAVVTEPATVSSMELILKDLKGRTGLVLLNAWDPLAEAHFRQWNPAFPVGAISMPHGSFGALQGRQVSSVVPSEGSILVVTGPSRSSAAIERLQALKASLRPGIQVFDTEAGQWSEAEGALAFSIWYGVFKSRQDAIQAVVGQSDDLAVGARRAAISVANPQHARMFSEARYFGVGAVPGFGKERVDDGTLYASIVAPANAGTAIDLLHRFWADGRRLPQRSFTDVVPYPLSRGGD
jgi:ABC-type sugar transport system substrate-binding protein